MCEHSPAPHTSSLHSIPAPSPVKESSKISWCARVYRRLLLCIAQSGVTAEATWVRVLCFCSGQRILVTCIQKPLALCRGSGWSARLCRCRLLGRATGQVHPRALTTVTVAALQSQCPVWHTGPIKPSVLILVIYKPEQYQGKGPPDNGSRRSSSPCFTVAGAALSYHLVTALSHQASVGLSVGKLGCLPKVVLWLAHCIDALSFR